MVPTCPNWTLSDLLGHTSATHRWAISVLDRPDQVHARDLPDPPLGLDARQEWFRASVSALTSRCAAISPSAPVWTPTAGVTGSEWWRRKMAVETAIHRWDAQNAVGSPQPLIGFVSVAGIQEFITDFLPRMVGHVAGAPEGCVCLVADDVEMCWNVDLDATDPAGVSDHGRRATTTIHGTSSDLLLWMWNRHIEPLSHRLTADGDQDVLTRWSTLAI